MPGLTRTLYGHQALKVVVGGIVEREIVEIRLQETTDASAIGIELKADDRVAGFGHISLRTAIMVFKTANNITFIAQMTPRQTVELETPFGCILVTLKAIRGHDAASINIEAPKDLKFIIEDPDQ